jgi:hypothetical protein
MNRENRELVTSVDKHIVLIKAWLTEKENRLIQRFWAKQTKISENANFENLEDGDVKIDITGSPELILDYYDILIEAYVYSVDESTEGVLEKIQDFRKEEYKEVTAFIQKLQDEEKKTTLTTVPITGESSISEDQN